MTSLSKEYAGGVILSNDTVVFVPHNATTVGIYDIPTNYVNTVNINAFITGNYKYNGGVLLQDGRVLFVPYNANNIGIYNPTTALFSVIDISSSITGDGKYARGVLLQDGRVVFVPYNADNIGIYNPITNIFSTLPSDQLVLGGNKYIGGVLFPNGNVLFVPSDANNIGLFNTSTYNFSVINISATINTSSKYNGGVLLPNGTVIFVPDNAGNIGIFNPSNSSNPLTLIDISSTINTIGKYSDGLLINDKVVFIPKQSNNIGIYDYYNKFVSFPFSIDAISTMINTTFLGGVLLASGEILLIPDTLEKIQKYTLGSTEVMPVFGLGTSVLPSIRTDSHVEYLFNNLNDTGVNATTLTLSEKPYVEYKFNGDYNNTGDTTTSLVRTGTGSDNTLYTDSTLGEGYGYIKVLPSYTVSANIAPTTTYLTIASKTAGAATGARIMFKIKLNNTINKATAIFTLGKRGNVTDTGVESWTNGNGAESRGIVFRMLSSGSPRLCYVCCDANGNFTQYNNNGAGALSTTAWTSVEIVIKKLIGADNKLLMDFYLNGTLAPISVDEFTTPELTFSYAGGTDNNLLRFTGYTEAHNIADFKIFLTDNRDAYSGISLKNDDAIVGNYLLVDNSTTTGLVSASAPINTSAQELISSTTLSGGTGLTISFDIKWDVIGNENAYYLLGIGQGINAISTWSQGSSTTATGIVIGRATPDGITPAAHIMLVNSTGQFLNFNNSSFGTITNFYSTTWKHIDIVFTPISLSANIYVNGEFKSTIVLNSNAVADNLSFAANSETRTHFAVQGTDAYQVANFRLWKTPLTSVEITANSVYSLITSESLTKKYKGSILLQDKRVLLIPNGFNKLSMYNPATNAFTYGANTSGYSGGVLLQDGRVLLIPNTASNISIYNPNNNILEVGPSATGYVGATFMQNGKVFLTASTATNSGIYDPLTNNFVEIIYPE